MSANIETFFKLESCEENSRKNTIKIKFDLTIN